MNLSPYVGMAESHAEVAVDRGGILLGRSHTVLIADITVDSKFRALASGRKLLPS
jgi:hypothetical protein